MFAIVIQEGGRDGVSIRYRSDDRKAPDTFWTEEFKKAFKTRSRRRAEKEKQDCPLNPMVLEI